MTWEVIIWSVCITIAAMGTFVYLIWAVIDFIVKMEEYKDNM